MVSRSCFVVITLWTVPPQATHAQQVPLAHDRTAAKVFLDQWGRDRPVFSLSLRDW